MAKKKFTGNRYKYIDGSFDQCYRYQIENGQIVATFNKSSRNKEKQVPDEAKKYGEDCWLYGYDITKEQYDNYDPRLGLVVCGIVKNHVNDTHLNEEQYAKDRAKGKRLGFIDPNDPD